MADEASSESRTEEATEKKLGDAIERGDVPFAREASLFASVSAMLIIGAFVANDFTAAMTALLRQMLDEAGDIGWHQRRDGSRRAESADQISARTAGRGGVDVWHGD